MLALVQPHVSVVIATYRRDAELCHAIQCVLAEAYPRMDLVVVDQTEHHPEVTERFLAAIDDSRFRHFSVGPPSLPAARNFGLGQASGDVVLFIDDDVDFTPGLVAAHAAAYSDPAVGAVAGRVRQPGVPQSDQLFTLSRSGVPAGGYDYPFAADAYSAMGCNMSFRREVLVGIGGFETGFVGAANHEEVDACQRVRRAGYRIRYEPAAVLDHLRSEAGGCRVDEGRDGPRSTMWHRNEVLFLMRNRPRWQWPLVAAGQLHWYALNRASLRDRTAWTRATRWAAGAAGAATARRGRTVVARPT